MKHLIFFLCSYLTIHFCYAQREIAPTDIERIIEEVFQGQDQDVNYEELYEILLLYLASPLDINSATVEQLESLFILSNHQVQSLMKYREKYGKLISVYELQAVPELDLVTIHRLKPFIKIDAGEPRESFKGLANRILQEPNNYLILRYERTLETKRGFKEPENEESSKYLGNADKLYSRFRTSNNRDFSIGFTLEKDGGEVLEWSRSQPGFDFTSYHVQVRNKRKLNNLILGDFQLQFGQGLVFGSGFNIGKGAETITTIRRTNLGALPYTSVSETGYFKGITSTVEIQKDIKITGLYSSLNQDARIIDDSTPFINPFIRSIQTSGLHRTPQERENRNAVNEQNLGGNIDYKSRNLNVGLNVLYTSYSEEIVRDNAIENSFRFSGQDNTVLSAYFNVRRLNYVLFGEIARSTSGGIGQILGLVSNISSNLESSLLIRNYEKDFHSFYSAGFGETARNRGEQGIYVGMKYTLNRKINITTFFDGFKFTSLTSRISRPSTGYEYLSRLNFRPNKQTLFYVQFRQQSKADNIANAELETNIKRTEQAVKTSYLVNFDFAISPLLSIKSRVQGSHQDFNKRSTMGFAIIQDVNVQLNRWSVSGRLGLFDTEDFDNRQYIYERDVLYRFSIPALSGQGLRNYVVIRFKASSKLDFWAKYGRTVFTDRKTVGSGLEEIDGNKRTTISVQTRIRF